MEHSMKLCGAMSRQRLDLIAMTLALVLIVVSVASACPNCKESLADPQQHSMATGYYYSILFMMSMPFAILGTFGSIAYFSIRRAREQQAAHSDELLPRSHKEH